MVWWFCLDTVIPSSMLHRITYLYLGHILFWDSPFLLYSCFCIMSFSSLFSDISA
uniref:Uncharacterized protein n=1 Tax=Rhizophora mucronata TaxID=61149 RepID=A0A2P2Q0X3_RHIMU